MSKFKSIDDQIAENAKDRKSYKSLVDKQFDLSAYVDDTNTMCLAVAGSGSLLSPKTVDGILSLSEGAVVDSVGNVRFYLTKGSVDAAIAKLKPSKEYVLNMGHVPYERSPINKVGSFLSTDVKSVDSGNNDGRKNMTISPTIDLEHPFMSYLQKKGANLSVSVELGINEYEFVESEKQKGLYVLAVTDFELKGLAIVGAPANVDSLAQVVLNVENTSNNLIKETNMSKEANTDKAEVVDTNLAANDSEVVDTNLATQLAQEVEKRVTAELTIKQLAEAKVNLEASFKAEIANKDAEIATLAAEVASMKAAADEVDAQLGAMLETVGKVAQKSVDTNSDLNAESQNAKAGTSTADEELASLTAL